MEPVALVVVAAAERVVALEALVARAEREEPAVAEARAAPEVREEPGAEEGPAEQRVAELLAEAPAVPAIAAAIPLITTTIIIR